ncbi:nuclear transport factor 2 family protein [Baekduia soli]|uniref:nuclear transport factor 2 family protein n=1 Tax=Baekduia soli TaxID=496014 RepID=UPI001651FBBB|nr:nuclear transport factor 2 family protein [Baekduia soli]
MDDLERTVAERACERLIVDYARLVDFGNASGIADLFTEDGVWIGSDLHLDGREAIREWFVEREALSRRVSRHVFTNIGVDVLSPDEAQSICYMINYRRDRRDGGDELPVAGDIPKWVGECHDRFARTADGWRFTQRRVEVAFHRPSRRPAAAEG